MIKYVGKPLVYWKTASMLALTPFHMDMSRG